MPTRTNLLFNLFIKENALSAERLQKVLASAGIASRRDCEELIGAGRVSVNGKVVVVPGTRVDPEQDEIAVDGQPIGKINPRTYVMLHKPAGVVSTAEDPHGRPTVVAMVDLPARLFPIGRLDYDSEGLLLLTDDGELTQRLTHPSYQVEKEYRALLDQAPSPEALREWRSGVLLDNIPTAPAWVDVLERGEDGVWVRVVLHEGRKRQIREVARLLGYDVLRLIRVREGPVLLGDLPAGEWRRLTDDEVEALWSHVGGPNAEPLETPARAVPARPRRRTADETAARPPRRAGREADPAAVAPAAPDDAAPRRPRRDAAEQSAPAPQRGERDGSPRGDRRDDAPRRDDRASSFDARGPRRDDRGSSFDARGPRRDDRGSSFDARGPRRDDRGGSFDARGSGAEGQNPDRPERGNERLPDRPEREEKRGPGREWHERTSQEKREQRSMARGRPGGYGSGRTFRRNGFPFRTRSSDDKDK